MNWDELFPAPKSIAELSKTNWKPGCRWVTLHGGKDKDGKKAGGRHVCIGGGKSPGTLAAGANPSYLKKEDLKPGTWFAFNEPGKTVSDGTDSMLSHGDQWRITGAYPDLIYARSKSNGAERTFPTKLLQQNAHKVEEPKTTIPEGMRTHATGDKTPGTFLKFTEGMYNTKDVWELLEPVGGYVGLVHIRNAKTGMVSQIQERFLETAKITKQPKHRVHEGRMGYENEALAKADLTKYPKEMSGEAPFRASASGFLVKKNGAYANPFAGNEMAMRQPSFQPAANAKEITARLQAQGMKPDIAKTIGKRYDLDSANDILARYEHLKSLGFEQSPTKWGIGTSRTTWIGEYQPWDHQIAVKNNYNYLSRQTYSTTRSTGDTYAHEYAHFLQDRMDATERNKAYDILDSFSSQFVLSHISEYAANDYRHDRWERYTEFFSLVTRPGYKAGSILGSAELEKRVLAPALLAAKSTIGDLVYE